MSDDIDALRKALKLCTFSGNTVSYPTVEWATAANPAVIAALLSRLDAAEADAERWRAQEAQIQILKDALFKAFSEVQFVDAMKEQTK